MKIIYVLIGAILLFSAGCDSGNDSKEIECTEETRGEEGCECKIDGTCNYGLLCATELHLDSDSDNSIIWDKAGHCKPVDY